MTNDKERERSYIDVYANDNPIWSSNEIEELRVVIQSSTADSHPARSDDHKVGKLLPM
jgi:hypothetical protein